MGKSSSQKRNTNSTNRRTIQNPPPRFEKAVKELGFYNSGTGKHQSNTVYSINGCIPTITTITGGGTIQIKVLRKWKREN